jgi:zinc-ribbon domain
MPACPHCSTPNADGSKFCVSCGRAVPAATRTGPRILTDNDLASSSAGQTMQLAELARQIKPAINTLLVLGVLHGIIGAVLLVIFKSDTSVDPSLGLMGGIVGALGAIFLGLSFWARKNPLPASIAGLTIYVTVTAIDVIMIITSNTAVSFGGGLLIRAFIIGALARAVSAAVKHRALTRQMAQEGGQPMRMAA